MGGTEKPWRKTSKIVSWTYIYSFWAYFAPMLGMEPKALSLCARSMWFIFYLIGAHSEEMTWVSQESHNFQQC